MSTSQFVLAFAILSSSFWGSWHCAGMCGPIASLMAHRKNLLSYHLGRGCSYILLGAVSGALGSWLLQSEVQGLRSAAAILFAFVLLYWGVQTYRGQKIHYPALGSRRMSFQSSGFWVGASSIFLPCGWLYTYLFAAAATQSPWAGAITLALFCAGSVPALSVLPVYIKKSLQMAGARKQKLGGLILISASLYSLGSFFWS